MTPPNGVPIPIFGKSDEHTLIYMNDDDQVIAFDNVRMSEAEDYQSEAEPDNWRYLELWHNVGHSARIHLPETDRDMCSLQIHDANGEAWSDHDDFTGALKGYLSAVRA